MGRIRLWARDPLVRHADTERLDSWKEIAAYLNRTPRSVQRWETEEGLPVHRLRHEKRGSVYALKSELDQWWNERAQSLGGPNQREVASSSREHKHQGQMMWLAGGGVAVVALAVILGFMISPGASVPPPHVIPLVTLRGEEFHSRFSPDGARVGISWKGAERKDFDFIVKQIGADGHVVFGGSPYHEVSGAWSPDGQWIAGLRIAGGGKLEITRQSAIGGAVEVIAEAMGPADDIGAKTLLGPFIEWSPDGNWLVFIDKDSPEQPSALFALDPKTNRKHRLTTPPPNSEGDAGPAFSPDGRFLAFHRKLTPSPTELLLLEVTVDMRPDGLPTRIETGNTFDFSPTWTPDGKEIIYCATRMSKYYPRLMRLRPGTGEPPRRVVSGGNSSWFPAVSPDGRRLSYSELKFIGDIWAITATGPGNPAEVPWRLISSTRLDLHPAFSPDGRKIAFASSRSGARELYVSAADGSDPVMLTSFGGAHVSNPSWSPDGRTIAFSADPESGSDIYVISLPGGKPSPLVAGPANDSTPVWTPDGRYVYFTSDRTGADQIWRKAASGGEPSQITRHGGGGPRFSDDGAWIYYAKTHAGMNPVWRVPAGGGNEEEVLASSYGTVEFQVVSNGLYFIPAAELTGRRQLLFYEFSTSAVSEVAELRSAGSSSGCYCEQYRGHGLTVSPDGKTIAFGQLDYLDSDIMLVENFR